MPSPERAGLTGYAVLWAANGINAYGDITVANPVEIRCRWEESIGEQLSPTTGATQDSSQSIMVDRLIPVDSILWLGKKKDLPTTLSNLRQVVTVKNVPDVKGRISLRTVDVIKFSNQLPTVST